MFLLLAAAAADDGAAAAAASVTYCVFNVLCDVHKTFIDRTNENDYLSMGIYMIVYVC